MIDQVKIQSRTVILIYIYIFFSGAHLALSVSAEGQDTLVTLCCRFYYSHEESGIIKLIRPSMVITRRNK